MNHGNYHTAWKAAWHTESPDFRIAEACTRSHHISAPYNTIGLWLLAGLIFSLSLGLKVTSVHGKATIP